MDPCMQTLKIALKVCLIVPPCQAVHSRCRVLFEFEERLSEAIRADVMEESGGLLLCPLPYSLPYALQPLLHGSPFLRSARAVLARIPLGPRPWLHRLRGGSLRVVHRLHSYYGGGLPLPPVHPLPHV